MGLCGCKSSSNGNTLIIQKHYECVKRTEDMRSIQEILVRICTTTILTQKPNIPAKEFTAGQIDNQRNACGQRHCDLSNIVSLIRLRFWMPKLTAIIKRNIRTCASCKREQELPVSMPIMAPLPKDRVVCSKPFENISKQRKMYVAIYTWLTTCVVHLEVAEDLIAGEFLRSFIRFSSRRGIPSVIRTDCGTNFTLSAKIIQTLYDSDIETGSSVMSYSANKEAPWMGSAWERLIGTLKRSDTDDPIYDSTLIQTVTQAKENNEYLTELCEYYNNNLNPKVITQNGKISHRPISRLIPLEIRSVSFNDPQQKQGSSECRTSKPIISQPSCRAKNKLDDATEKDTSINSNKSYAHAFLFPLMLMTVISKTSAEDSHTIFCNNGIVKINHVIKKFDLCFNSECRIFNEQSKPLELILLPPPHNDATIARIKAPILKSQRHFRNMLPANNFGIFPKIPFSIINRESTLLAN
uniref:Integrase catalytic domain-containing protein n=1 Tax=Heterorhabditis bacteriophora TaxID=37862 RepID=A0A1I7WGB6_HETBA